MFLKIKMNTAVVCRSWLARAQTMQPLLCQRAYAKSYQSSGTHGAPAHAWHATKAQREKEKVRITSPHHKQQVKVSGVHPYPDIHPPQSEL
jgi:hypothetical protein